MTFMNISVWRAKIEGGYLFSRLQAIIVVNCQSWVLVLQASVNNQHKSLSITNNHFQCLSSQITINLYISNTHFFDTSTSLCQSVWIITNLHKTTVADKSLTFSIFLKVQLTNNDSLTNFLKPYKTLSVFVNQFQSLSIIVNIKYHQSLESLQINSIY